MPTYEYRCKDCGHELEAVQSFHDEALTECPSCGGALKKRFGTVGISFKGSGFYKNDSRTKASSSSSSESSSSSDSPASSDSSDSGTSTTKTDSSPAKADKSDSSASSGDTGSKSKAPAST